MHRNGKPAEYSQDKIEDYLASYGEMMEELGDTLDINYIAKMYIFIMLVQNNSIFDIKRQDDWQNPYETGESAMSTPFIYFNGMLLSAEEVSNIIFGYLGTAYGYSTTFLCAGAGAYQVFTGGSDWSYFSTYFDEPRDTEMIKLGAYYYNNGF